jgi:hypothetical protein
MACNAAADLRAAREEETGRGVCPSSLYNSASLVNYTVTTIHRAPVRYNPGGIDYLSEVCHVPELAGTLCDELLPHSEDQIRNC